MARAGAELPRLLRRPEPARALVSLRRDRRPGRAGAAGAGEYYAQSSSGPFVDRVRVPLLLLSAEDDPFIPALCIPRTANPSVILEVSRHGGHLGFVEGPPWRPRFHAERRAADFLAAQL